MGDNLKWQPKRTISFITNTAMELESEETSQMWSSDVGLIKTHFTLKDTKIEFALNPLP